MLKSRFSAANVLLCLSSIRNHFAHMSDKRQIVFHCKTVVYIWTVLRRTVLAYGEVVVGTSKLPFADELSKHVEQIKVADKSSLLISLVISNKRGAEIKKVAFYKVGISIQKFLMKYARQKKNENYMRDPPPSSHPSSTWSIIQPLIPSAHRLIIFRQCASIFFLIAKRTELFIVHATSISPHYSLVSSVKCSAEKWVFPCTSG